MQRALVYPRPQWIREKEGLEFAVTAGVPILATPGVRAEAGHLARWLQQDQGLDLAVKGYAEGREGIVVGLLGDGAIRDWCSRHGLRLDGREAVAEGYLLDAGPDHVLVAGHDPAGTFYGLQLLRQLVRREAGGLYVGGAEVHDWPYKGLRGVHLYMPPRKELPFCGRLLEALASLRYNTLFLEVGGGMRYDRHPEINSGWEEYVRRITALPGWVAEAEHSFPFPKDSTHYELAGGSFLEKDEVRGILAQARALHIEVIPEVQSLSHSYYLCCPHPEIAERAEDPLPDTYCPSNPASYQLLFEVMDEVIEVFQPRTIHTGHDEAYTYGVCPRCRGKSGAELIAGDINRIHDYLAAKGIRMAMWGDKLMDIVVGGRPHGGREITVPAGAWFKSTEDYVMAETYPAVDSVPKDILILNWTWGLDPSAHEYFARKGFEQIYGNLAQQGYRAFAGWQRLAAPASVLGAEVSTWCEVSEWALGHDACLFNMMYSAQPLWWQHHHDRERERVLGAVARLQPALRERLSGKRLPTLAAGVTYTPFPIGGAANALTDGIGQPEGTVELAGAPFAIAGAPANTIRVDGEHPEAAPIAVGARADSLLFVHHSHCRRRYFSTYDDTYVVAPTPEGVLGWYRVLYEDGSAAEVEICYGETIANGDVRYGEDTAAVPYWAEPVWEGRDEEGRPVTFYRYEWANPEPGKRIASVQMRSAGGEGSVELLAVTGVRAG